MTATLLYQTHSPFARKALVFAHEAGIAHKIDVVHHETSPTARNEQVFGHNPLGKVPVLLRQDMPPIRQAAEALECKLVYAFVPIKPLDDILRDRARKKAYDQYAMVAKGMLLENQALTVSQMNEEIDRLTEEILAEPLRFLWAGE